MVLIPADPNNSFDTAAAALADSVGDGDLVGDLDRDQVYAQFQHETPGLNHPVGDWKYQEGPLYERHGDYLQTVADHVHDLARGPAEAMADVVEQLDSDTGARTPKDLTILAHSGHPVVTSDGQVVYDRPPEVPRLTEAELDAPRRAGVRGYTTNNPGVR